ncbi:MAG: adenylyl-sulfate kinase [Dinoroseobacter sp.]|nr:adenylyl-sulfate kinase [Dinoroseobacter sp.]
MDNSTPTEPPVLIVFGGRPGSGKSTIALALTRQIGAVLLEIDRIEAPLQAKLGRDIGPLGYNVAYQAATSNLDLGHIVVADCVNPIAVTRNAWASVAMGCKAVLIQVNVACSDTQEHRRRVEKRLIERPMQGLPDWDSVQARSIDEWPDADITLDTATLAPGAAVAAIVSNLRHLVPSRFGLSTPAKKML